MPVSRDRAGIAAGRLSFDSRYSAGRTVSWRSMNAEILARTMSWRNCSAGCPSCPSKDLCAPFLECRDALGGHRMRLHIGVGTARGEQAVIGEPLEGLVHALADWPVAVKNFTPARSASLPAGVRRRAGCAGSFPAGLRTAAAADIGQDH